MIVIAQQGLAGMFAGVSLAEADEAVHKGHDEGGEDVTDTERGGVEVRADPRVVDDVGQQEK